MLSVSVKPYVRQVHAPIIFTSTCPTTGTCLPHLHAIAVNTTACFRGLLGYFTLNQMNSIECIFDDIGEPDPWPSTINSLWSYLMTAVDEEWMNFGNKLSDIKELALEDSAPVVIAPPTIPKYSALAEKPHHRDSFACLDSPLKSLPAEVADLGSFSIFSFSFLPQGSRSNVH